ncbi:hypothetical protein [Streptomyces niveus]|uniref:hypothetical protein n=1 Tax=Streptomyces niveus TaxID=193462 RepID=UPI0036D30395
MVLAQSITTPDQYLGASRRGRGTALGSAKRLVVWGAIEEFERRLSDDRKWTYLQVRAEAARLLRSGPGAAQHRHVVVDEAQDLHPVQWRVLRGRWLPVGTTSSSRAILISGSTTPACHWGPWASC